MDEKIYSEEHNIEPQGIHEIISNYRKSIIATEEEVKSKFILPLTKWLGYSDQYRADEFPVYGYSGRTPLNAKSADYIFFSGTDFNNHRSRTDDNLRWVEDHSLMIIEAKKPGEMAEIQGQAQFYQRWTKALCYLVIDGNRIKGYVVNSTVSDLQILDCDIDKLPDNQVLDLMKFNVLCEMKNNYREHTESILAMVERLLEENNEQEQENVLFDDFDYLVDDIDSIRNDLGADAEGRSDQEVIELFRDTVKFNLDHNLRYDIPDFMINIPRESYEGILSIKGVICPSLLGTVERYYYENLDILLFTEGYLDLLLYVVDGVPVRVTFGFHIFDSTVDQRICNFKRLRPFIEANNLFFYIKNIDDGKDLSLLIPKSGVMTNKHLLPVFDYYEEEMYDLKTIEEYYGIKFKMEELIEGEEESILDDAIYQVSQGIRGKQNVTSTINKSIISETIEIDTPLLWKDSLLRNYKEDFRDFKIHNIIFVPDRITILPCKLKKSFGFGRQTINIPLSILYKPCIEDQE